MHFTTFLPRRAASSLWIPVSAPYLDEEFIQQKLPEDREWEDKAREAWVYPDGKTQWLSYWLFYKAPITLHWGPFKSVCWLDLSVLSPPPLDPVNSWVWTDQATYLHTNSLNICSVSIVSWADPHFLLHSLWHTSYQFDKHLLAFHMFWNYFVCQWQELSHIVSLLDIEIHENHTATKAVAYCTCTQSLIYGGVP